MGSRFNNCRKKCTCKHDDCWDVFEECKKEQHEKCDSSCVQGIRDELKKLINKTVRINTEGRTYIGTVSSVTCDVVKLAAIPGSVAAIISLCKIEAILPPATTVADEFDFNGVDVANKE
ncbi:hypothetical protein CN575_03930 [Bacillus wiedmannii]|uniref:Exosporium protein K n=5 Tax=Bacillus cereus group TaxID=86661 RepID=A0A2C5PGW7_9BACI|nr:MULTISPECIES: hypothetical protein [Bacillus]EOP10868.1 hypothetical protein ICS_03120 [Bacillus cereus BAG2O-3]EOQ11560.1 hypothetical protein KQ3_01773 [Bacillus cereus B5-2]EOQ30584.1 hypothetical protein KQ1_02433 [Bacillus cereus BAG3O-1]PFW86762.1 hypothetical protein COL27_02110 [Bacillus sp. AFS075960]RFB12756.1 hypothetical protein DZB88_12500 [Bacillus sp. OE]RFB23953.1 hypothetical protein DZB85_16095 [Bacillus sp. LB(2018)]RFB44896.1 hypothetical protein DZB83_18265 [Bacillus 